MGKDHLSIPNSTCRVYVKNCGYNSDDGDFQEKNIHYSNESYTLIDFDMTCPSYYVFDLAILFSGLKFFNLNYTEDIRDQTIA